MSHASPRAVRVIAGFEVVAVVLVLNLLFLLTSLAVVTVVPAALALQASIPRPGQSDTAATIRGYFRLFGRYCRFAWVPAVLALVALSAAWIALSFYLAAAPVLAVPALVLLTPLFGFAIAVYLAFLEVGRSPSAVAQGWRASVRQAIRTVVARPLPAAGAVLLLGTAIMLLVRLPTLIPALVGVLPAYIALWSFGPKRSVRVPTA